MPLKMHSMLWIHHPNQTCYFGFGTVFIGGCPEFPHQECPYVQTNPSQVKQFVGTSNQWWGKPNLDLEDWPRWSWSSQVSLPQEYNELKVVVWFVASTMPHHGSNHLGRFLAQCLAYFHLSLKPQLTQQLHANFWLLDHDRKVFAWLGSFAIGVPCPLN